MRRRFPLCRLLLLSLLGLVLGGAECGPPSEPDPDPVLEESDAILAPEEVGELPGSLRATASGQAAYTIPLEVPIGRAGMQPSLALSYSSARGDGALGVGWSLAGAESSIAPCAPTFAQDGHPGRIRYLDLSLQVRCEAGHCDFAQPMCLDGARLLPLQEGASAFHLEARPESDPKTRVLYEAGSFHVFSPSGSVTEYAHRITVPDFPRRVAAWRRSRVRDRYGNSIEYAHEDLGEEEGCLEPRVTSIRYTGRHSVNGSELEAPRREVRLVYAPRFWNEGQPRHYVDGACWQRTKRLSRLEMHGPDLNGETVEAWRYELGYLLSVPTRRALLSRVQRCAIGSCLPATALSYSHVEPGFIAETTSIEDYGLSTDIFVGTPPVLDVDADGAADLVTLGRSLAGEIHLGSRGGFSAPLPFTLPYDQAAERAVPWDFDGDGRTELLLRSARRTPDAHRWQPARWEASVGNLVRVEELGFGPTETALFPPVVDEDPEERLLVADLNGDGIADLLYPAGEEEGSPGGLYVRLSEPATGAIGVLRRWLQGVPVDTQSARVVEWDGDTGTEVLIQAIAPTAGAYVLDADPEAQLEQPRLIPTELRLVPKLTPDLNGDGLSDVCRVVGWHDLECRLNTGAGLGAPFDPRLDPSEPFGAPPHVRATAGGLERVLDFNGDGLDDLFAATGGDGFEIWLSDGQQLRRRSFRAPSDLGLSTYPSGPVLYRLMRVGDFDADGFSDVLYAEGNRDRSRAVVLHRRRAPHAILPDLLTAVTSGLGARAEIRYERLAEATPSEDFRRPLYLPGEGCTYPDRCVVRAGLVVKSLSFDDGLGGQRTLEMSYEDGREDLHGRSFVGFSRVREIERLGFSSGRGDSEPRRETLTRYDLDTRLDGRLPFAGQPIERTVTTTLEDGRELIERSTFALEYHPMPSQGGAYLVRVREHRTESFERTSGREPELLSSSVSRVLEFDDFDHWRRMEQRVEPDGGHEVATRTIDNDQAAWLLGRVRYQSTTSFGDAFGRSETLEETRQYTPEGALYEHILEPGSAHPLTSTYHRNGDGQVQRVELAGDGELRSFDYGYDTLDRVHIESLTNALGHTERWSIHPTVGVAFAYEDARGARSSFSFDAFGRPRRATLAGGASATFTRASGTVSGTESPLIETVSRSSGEVRRTARDRLGRPILTEERGFDGRAVQQRVSYDHLGRVQSSTRPAFEGEAPAFIAHLRHDAAGRLIEEDTPHGTRRRAYPGRSVIETSEDGIEREIERDGAGRLRRSRNLSADASEAEVRYGYGPFGTLERVERGPEHAPLSTWEALHDARGHRVWERDPDRGERTALYDAFGQLTEANRAEVGASHFGYDLLGRPLWRTDPEGTTRYTYDEGPYGAGLLTSTESPDGVRIVRDHDRFGRLRSESWVHRGGGSSSTFRFDYRYDGQGRLRELLFPRGPLASTARFGVRIERSAQGFVRALRDVRNDRVLSEVHARNADGAPTSSTLGNGLLVTLGYAPRTGELSSLWLRRGSSPLVHRSWERGVEGLLEEQRDHLRDRVETFGYDDARRLSSWEVREGTESRSTAYDYDPLGNLTLRGGEVLRYTGSSPHQLSEAGGDSRYRYDGAGRLRQLRDTAIEYNAQDLPILELSSEGAALTGYDPEGARASEERAGERSLFASELYRRTTFTDGRVRHLYRVPGLVDVVQEEEGGGALREQALYPHADPLGTTIAVTDERGELLEEPRYDPFGRREGATDPDIPATYAGHELRPGGTVHMRGRIYDPATARFLSPDPIVTDTALSADWNPYAYVRNAPTVYTDPSGYSLDDYFRSHPELTHQQADAPAPLRRVPVTEQPDPDGGGGGGGSGDGGGGGGTSQGPSHAGTADPAGTTDSGTTLPPTPEPPTVNSMGRAFGEGFAAGVLGIGQGIIESATTLPRWSYEAVQDARRGNYTRAAMGAASVLIPAIGLGRWAAEETERISEGFEGAGAVMNSDDPHDRARAAGALTAVAGAVVLTRRLGGPGAARASSRRLGAALEAAGEARPPGAHAHHIVAGGAPGAARARRLLTRFGIRINDAENGVFLPGNTGTPNPTGATVHSTMHTGSYYQRVEALLAEATSRDDAVRILRGIARNLREGRSL